MELTMKPRSETPKSYQYFCDLTETLDEMLGISKTSLFRHYCLIKEDQLVIRVPGSTVGVCTFNKDMVITDISFTAENYQSFDLTSFIGQHLELSE